MKLLNFFKKKYNEPLGTYSVTLQRRNEEHPSYTITSISAKSPEEAAEIAKKFVAENGFWSVCLNTSERMSCLTAVEIISET